MTTKTKKIFPKRKLAFTVSAEDVTNGIPKDTERCVFACAIKETIPGLDTSHPSGGVEVGLGRTKVHTKNAEGQTETRFYATPAVLKPAIEHYDKTGEWLLEEGDYAFLPIKHTPRTPEQIAAQKERDKKRVANGGISMDNKKFQDKAKRTLKKHRTD